MMSSNTFLTKILAEDATVNRLHRQHVYDVLLLFMRRACADLSRAEPLIVRPAAYAGKRLLWVEFDHPDVVTVKLPVKTNADYAREIQDETTRQNLFQAQYNQFYQITNSSGSLSRSTSSQATNGGVPRVTEIFHMNQSSGVRPGQHKIPSTDPNFDHQMFNTRPELQSVFPQSYTRQVHFPSYYPPGVFGRPSSVLIDRYAPLVSAARLPPSNVVTSNEGLSTTNNVEDTFSDICPPKMSRSLKELIQHVEMIQNVGTG